MPKVTVLMPAYNVEKYVKEAIESVLKQTYANFVLLVMDDCSTDDTADVVKSIPDARIRYEKNEHNLGLADNLNRGLSLIDTEYIARMDGDDIALSTWLEKEVAYLDTHTDVGICSAGGQRFGTSTSIVRFPENNEDIKANMLFGCTVLVPTFRMKLYTDYGLRYRTDAFPAEDFRFWAECVRVTKIYNIPESLFLYRMHETQICTAKHNVQIGKADEVKLFMLDWLNPNLTAEDKSFFINNFVTGTIESKADWKKLKTFANYLISRNTEVGNYSTHALQKRFKKLRVLSLYQHFVNGCFLNGFNPRNYFSYLRSGLAFHMYPKYEIKFFVNSLLHKNK